MMKSFNELLEIHKRLDELFLEHQRWLLRLDLKGGGRSPGVLHDRALRPHAGRGGMDDSNVSRAGRSSRWRRG